MSHFPYFSRSTLSKSFQMELFEGHASPADDGARAGILQQGRFQAYLLNSKKVLDFQLMKMHLKVLVYSITVFHRILCLHNILIETLAISA